MIITQSRQKELNTELRTLCADLAAHVAYMQAQMVEENQYSDLEDCYWYRESVKLLRRGRTVLTELPTTT